MGSSQIRFRAWEKEMKEMIPVDDISFKSKQINTGSAWRCFEEVELMQYTGLKDKNDVMIYEGDIVEAPYSKTKYLVDYINGCFVGRIKYREYKALYKSLKVIGNKFENPELLESEAE